MLRQMWTVPLAALTAIGSLTLATAEEPKEAGGRKQGPPKEIAVDLGGGVKLEMTLIPVGKFTMGPLDRGWDAYGNESPRHDVRITRPFYLGKYKVTQEQWQAVVGDNPSHFKGPKNPVETVSWDDCRKFLETLNKKLGGGRFSLPTEAQWEYASSTGKNTMYCFGNDESQLGEYAWYDKNSGDKTHPVGEKKPNAWGLYDVYGNVCEWCQDWYHGDYYKESPVDDPGGAKTGSVRVFRGSSWLSYPWVCRSGYRSGGAPPGYRYDYVGLRVCRAVAE